MIFVKDGQRIATENFVSGKVYNILFVTGISTNMMCTSIGADCVVFQGQAPLNLFTLTMQNADIVDSIEESSGSTESYNDLTNKPQINNVTLSGNKSLSDLGIAAAASFTVGSSDNGKVLTAIYEEGQGSYAWVTPSGGGGTTDYTMLENKPQINNVTLTGNKSLSDLGIAAAADIPTVPITEIQKNSTTISPVSGVVNITVPTSAADVSAIPTTEKCANSGVATLDSSGKLTAAQLPLGTTSTTAYRGDRGNTAYTHATDSSRLTTATASGLYKVASTNQGHIASLTAVEKSDITALGIPAQDTTYNNATTTTAGLMSAADKTELIELVDNGAKNKIFVDKLNTTNANGVTYTINSDGTITANGTPSGTSPSYVVVAMPDGSTYKDFSKYCNGTNVLSGCPSGGSSSTYRMYITGTDYTLVDYGNGVELTDTSVSPLYLIIYIYNGYTASNLTFKPMICSKAAWDVSQKYVPYAPTNSELYEMIKAL